MHRRISASEAQTAEQLPAQVVEITVDELAVPTAYMYGGRVLTPVCTSGFTVRATNGNEGFTTAAHCDNYLEFEGDHMPLFDENKNDNFDVQWHTSPSPWDDRAWFLSRDGAPNPVREVHYVRGRHHQHKGDWVCKSGRSTGYTCGTIVDRSVCMGYIRSCDPTFIRVDRNGDGPMALGGDSGGPVFRLNTAWGTVSGGIRANNNEYYDMVYMPINYVARARIGVDRIQTTQ